MRFVTYRLMIHVMNKNRQFGRMCYRRIITGSSWSPCTHVDQLVRCFALKHPSLEHPCVSWQSEWSPLLHEQSNDQVLQYPTGLLLSAVVCISLSIYDESSTPITTIGVECCLNVCRMEEPQITTGTVLLSLKKKHSTEVRCNCS